MTIFKYDALGYYLGHNIDSFYVLDNTHDFWNKVSFEFSLSSCQIRYEKF